MNGCVARSGAADVGLGPGAALPAGVGLGRRNVAAEGDVTGVPEGGAEDIGLGPESPQPAMRITTAAMTTGPHPDNNLRTMRNSLASGSRHEVDRSVQVQGGSWVRAVSVEAMMPWSPTLQTSSQRLLISSTPSVRWSCDPPCPSSAGPRVANCVAATAMARSA